VGNHEGTEGREGRVLETVENSFGFSVALGHRAKAAVLMRRAREVRS